MYCKKCNKEYPKKTKLCKTCGIALVNGKPPVVEKGFNKTIFIVGGAIAVLVIVAFLLVGLLGMVPADVKGTWYELNGYDYVYEFKPFNKIEYKGHGQTYTGTYNYDPKTKTGTIQSDFEEHTVREFTFDNATITMDISVFTRKVVEQFDSESAFEQLIDEIKTEEEK